MAPCKEPVYGGLFDRLPAEQRVKLTVDYDTKMLMGFKIDRVVRILYHTSLFGDISHVVFIKAFYRM